MLFSEPKISQSEDPALLALFASGFQCSSASRKFLNRDAHPGAVSSPIVSVLFSEPKISQFNKRLDRRRSFARFSALQRAENFSIETNPSGTVYGAPFQCSSASRKFLNELDRNSPDRRQAVSVLFSEPKISQSTATRSKTRNRPLFQCSSASRKFLNARRHLKPVDPSTFQCSSASRKFLNLHDVA